MKNTSSKLAPIALLLSSCTAWAGDVNSVSIDRGSDPAPSISAVNLSTSSDEYNKACRSNRRILRNFIWSYAERATASIGIPKAGLYTMGLVANVALRESTEIYLNKSKSFSLELNNAPNEERAISLKFHAKW